MTNKFFAACVFCGIAFLGGPFALGIQDGEKNATDSYPQKSITIIVPYTAGGTADLVGRQLAAQLKKQLGKSVTIINQPGASGATGTKTVFDAPADGYTLLFSADSLGTQRVMGISTMSYNDFTPILTAVDDPKVIVVKKNSIYTTLNELIADMKARPGKVKMSYTGPGGSGHIQSLIYNKFGLEPALTAYPGGADCLVAVLAGQVDFTNANYSTVTAYIESGDLLLLGVSSATRLASRPTIPAFAEIIPESAQYLRMPFTPLSLLAHKNTPPRIVSILREAANKIVNEREWQSYVAENSLEALYHKYPDEAASKQFYADWESYVSYLLWDSGAVKNNPADFAIPRPR